MTVEVKKCTCFVVGIGFWAVADPLRSEGFTYSLMHWYSPFRSNSYFVPVNNMRFCQHWSDDWHILHLRFLKMSPLQSICDVLISLFIQAVLAASLSFLPFRSYQGFSALCFSLEIDATQTNYNCNYMSQLRACGPVIPGLLSCRPDSGPTSVRVGLLQQPGLPLRWWILFLL